MDAILLNKLDPSQESKHRTFFHWQFLDFKWVTHNRVCICDMNTEVRLCNTNKTNGMEEKGELP